MEIFVARLNEFVPKGKQELIAGLAGLRPETISRWKNGQNLRVRLDTLEKLAQALGKTVGDLILDEPEKGAEARLRRELELTKAKLRRVQNLLARAVQESED